MKDEVRILLLKELKCNGIVQTFYCIIRGSKGIEHIGLVKGEVRSLNTHPYFKGLMSEVRYIIDLDASEGKLKEMPGLEDNMPFIEEVVKVSYKLICRRD
jgi:hypothetical protein